jgi:hypothetical protein
MGFEELDQRVDPAVRRHEQEVIVKTVDQRPTTQR